MTASEIIMMIHIVALWAWGIWLLRALRKSEAQNRFHRKRHRELCGECMRYGGGCEYLQSLASAR